jgi:hypothetical protein
MGASKGATMECHQSTECFQCLRREEEHAAVPADVPVVCLGFNVNWNIATCSGLLQPPAARPEVQLAQTSLSGVIRVC